MSQKFAFCSSFMDKGIPSDLFVILQDYFDDLVNHDNVYITGILRTTSTIEVELDDVLFHIGEKLENTRVADFDLSFSTNLLADAFVARYSNKEGKFILYKNHLII